jgi:hypothetical protein
LTTAALRALALVVAVAAVMDPPVTVRRDQPPNVRLVGEAAHPAADRVRDALGRVATFDANRAADGVVLLDPEPTGMEAVADGVPFSVVSGRDDGAPRVLSIDRPAPVAPGQLAAVDATVLAVDQRPVRISLVVNGIEAAREVHRPTATGERFAVRLTYVPPHPGVQRVQVVTTFEDAPGDESRSAFDIPLVVTDRALRVLVFEPRPSWAATFVRRALEGDPRFEVSAIARASRGIAVRAGNPPDRVTRETLRGFDAVIVGGPEELVAGDVEALDDFAQLRGGAVVLLPDRRPSGAYTRLIGRGRVDEVLLETPAVLEASASGSLTAAEFALPRDHAGGNVLGSLRHQGQARPAVVSWPHGAGRVVFSGALDAWRYRAQRDGGYARFWTTTVGNLAASAPPPLHLEVDPALVAPGGVVTVRAAMRPAELALGAATIEVPPIAATLVDGEGRERPVRLWPAAETGAFEGAFRPPAAGRYLVRARTTGAAAETPVIVEPGIRQPPRPSTDAIEALAVASGGVATSAEQLDALVRQVEQMDGREALVTRYPMRSAWWVVPFGAALCAEWALRRRSGRR